MIPQLFDINVARFLDWLMYTRNGIYACLENDCRWMRNPLHYRLCVQEIGIEIIWLYR